jgi:hypothetical protein
LVRALSARYWHTKRQFNELSHAVITTREAAMAAFAKSWRRE